MNIRCLTLPFLLILLAGCGGETDFEKLNARAREEYLGTVRPGSADGAPFWNAFSTKFTYAPAFDFTDVNGAASYRFDFYLIDKLYSNYTLPVRDERPSAEDKLKEYQEKATFVTSFISDNPKAALSPVWNSLPVGNIGLVVSALDKEGGTVGLAGTREFLRDFPFEGPYPQAPRSYIEAANRGLEFMEKEPIVKAFKKMGDDLVLDTVTCQYYYERFCNEYTPGGTVYADKFGGAAIRLEVAMARLNGDKAEEHIKTARRAADFLMKISQGEDAPLAHFPPTYYRHDRQIDVMMALDPVMAANAYLDLYDYTRDTKYFDEVLLMMDTYDKLVDSSGFIPKKLYVATGEGVNDAGALTGSLLILAQRLHNDYGVTQYDDLAGRCEKYMYEKAIPDFNMSGQFEDVTVQGLHAYQNLTNIMANSYARYLLRKEDRTEEDISYARDMIRFVEDQFVHWNMLSNDRINPVFLSPGVYEQYYCAISIDGSAANTILALLAYYDATGDELCFEKARALVNAIVRAQNPLSGEIPTFWAPWYDSNSFWINCSMASVEVLMLFDSYVR